MHNCKETKERLLELLLDQTDKDISTELGHCAECNAEFEAVNATLRMTSRISETAAPEDNYWAGYHATLRQRLLTAQTGPIDSRAKAQGHKEKLGPLFEPLRPGAGTSLIVRLLKTTVPVPLPLGIALIVAAALLIPFAIRATKQEVSPATPIIVHVPVEVPVEKEKIVTQIVYRDRRPVIKTTTQVNPHTESTFAKSQPPETSPASLDGFKPTDEVKLVVIKGGRQK
jgi:hypothetical protein